MTPPVPAPRGLLPTRLSRIAGALAALTLLAVTPDAAAARTQAEDRIAPVPPEVADAVAGKVAVITGTSSGLGSELAELAATLGMKVVLADIDLAPSVALAERIEAEGGEAVAVEVDLADPAQRPRVLETAVERFGGVDVLFNNAGYAYAATLELHDLDAAHRLFEVNYWAYVDLAHRAIPLMRGRGGGTIVNTVSILGHQPAPPGWGVYAASKRALVGMFETAATELADEGIRIRLASPGGMRTNILRDAVGPLADRSRDGADDWESPAVVARDIFVMMMGDEVVFFPGYVGRR
jgi:NAD(P)-dependent dehydrogenase (short-subunit alcohol dehydrogenase family)